jgi:PKD repeat protein
MTPKIHRTSTLLTTCSSSPSRGHRHVCGDFVRHRRPRQTVVVSNPPNTPPVAVFTTSCAGLTCTFSALPSTDSDGQITKYAWNFGDDIMGEGTLAGQTYAAPGTYTVTLPVTDNLGATEMRTHTVTAVRRPIHVADLDGAGAAVQSKWNATVTISVHDGGHAPVAGVVVTGFWNDGTNATCTTTGDGRCAVIKSGLLKNAKASFSISTCRTQHSRTPPAAIMTSTVIATAPRLPSPDDRPSPDIREA